MHKIGLPTTIDVSKEQVNGKNIRNNIDKPIVLKFDTLPVDTKIEAVLYCILEGRNVSIPKGVTVSGDEDTIQAGSSSWEMRIRPKRPKSVMYNNTNTPLTGKQCIISVIIGHNSWVTTPFLIHTNQGQVQDRTLIRPRGNEQKKLKLEQTPEVQKRKTAQNDEIMNAIEKLSKSTEEHFREIRKRLDSLENNNQTP